jgi:hypothetical protein
MEKDLSSCGIPQKAEATLGANGQNGALHRGTSSLVWAV